MYVFVCVVCVCLCACQVCMLFVPMCFHVRLRLCIFRGVCMLASVCMSAYAVVCTAVDTCGVCMYRDVQYEYRVCPYRNVTQRDHRVSSGRARMMCHRLRRGVAASVQGGWNAYYGILGIWGKWRAVNGTWHSMLFTDGSDCSGGVRREVEVRRHLRMLLRSQIPAPRHEMTMRDPRRLNSSVAVRWR
jgi:hypothetical protein